MLLFSLDNDNDSAFAHALAKGLGVMLSAHDDHAFDDGERKLRPLVDPRSADVYVVHSLHGGPRLTPNDKLMSLLMFIGVLRDHGAERVTAVLPYLAYAREDRLTKPFDPLSLRYVAQLLEAVGTSEVIVLEAHNQAAFQNAFRCTTTHIDAHHAFDAVAAELKGHGDLVVASPDSGGVKRAQLWRESLEERLSIGVGFAFVDKRRSAGLVDTGLGVTGEVNGATVLLLDDLIATGETLKRAACALRRAGAREVVAFAAHGLFAGQAAEVLADPSISQLVVTDSVPPFRIAATGAVGRKLKIATAAPLFAKVISDRALAWQI